MDRLFQDQFPCSPKDEIDGLVYFPRLCSKVRLFAEGTLHPDLHANLGRAMDLWACQFLGVEYDALAEVIKAGASDEDALAWARKQGSERPEHERDWWNSYMRNTGYRDFLSDKLLARIVESGLTGDTNIQTMFDYIDADEGRE